MAAQRQNLRRPQQQFNGTAEFRPEFHLPRNRSLHSFPGKPRIKNKRIGKFNWLAHTLTVA